MWTPSWVKLKSRAEQGLTYVVLVFRIKLVRRTLEFWFFLVLLMMPSPLQNFNAKFNFIVFSTPQFTECMMLIPSHRGAVEIN